MPVWSWVQPCITTISAGDAAGADGTNFHIASAPGFEPKLVTWDVVPATATAGLASATTTAAVSAHFMSDLRSQGEEERALAVGLARAHRVVLASPVEPEPRTDRGLGREPPRRPEVHQVLLGEVLRALVVVDPCRRQTAADQRHRVDVDTARRGPPGEHLAGQPHPVVGVDDL